MHGLQWDYSFIPATIRKHYPITKGIQRLGSNDLRPWSRILLENINVSQKVKTFLAFYGK